MVTEGINVIRGDGQGWYMEYGPHSMAMHASSLYRHMRDRFYTWVLPAHAPTYIYLFTQTYCASKMLKYVYSCPCTDTGMQPSTLMKGSPHFSPLVIPTLCWVLGHCRALRAPRSFRPWTIVELKQGLCASIANSFLSLTEL